MRNKGLNILLLIIAIVIATVAVGEILLRHNGIRPDTDCHSHANPLVLFEPDSSLGWKNKPGEHTFFSCSSGKEIFRFHINKSGNRISSVSDTDEATKDKPAIYIYGSQYTFGFSIADSATCAYILQGLLPDMKVVNKSATMYGLSQMYMSLKKSFSQGDTPAIVIINYADLDDLHTPLSKQMGLQVTENILYGNTKDFDQCLFPYFEYKNNHLDIQRCHLHDFARLNPIVRYSSIALALNAYYFDYCDDKSYAYRHEISYYTVLEMMQYCKANHIVPIFASIYNSTDVNTLNKNKNTKPSTDILDSLTGKGYYTIEYGIDIKERKYNTEEREYTEPNEAAHAIFAQKINDFIKEKMLSNNLPKHLN